MGAAAVFTASTVAMLRLTSGPRQASLLGLRSAATSVGGVVWPLVGGAVAVLGWRSPFVVYLLGVPLGVAALLILPRDTAPAVDSPSAFSSVLSVLRRRPVAPLCLLFGMGTALLYLALVFVPIELSAAGLRSSMAAALVAAAMSAAMSISSLSYARLSARMRDLRLLSLAYGAIAAGLFVMAMAPAGHGTAIGAVVFGAGFGPTIPVLTAMLGAAVPGDLLGRAMALSGTAIFLGQFLSPLVFGPVVDHSSPQAGFLAAGLLTAVLAAVVGFAARGETRPPLGTSARFGRSRR